MIETGPTTIDPTWGVPVIFLIIAVIGVTWAKLTAMARDRRRTRPDATTSPQVNPSSPR